MSETNSTIIEESKDNTIVNNKPSIVIDELCRTWQRCNTCGELYLTEKYSRCPDCKVDR